MFEKKQLSPGKYLLRLVEETRADVPEQRSLTTWRAEAQRGRPVYKGTEK